MPAIMVLSRATRIIFRSIPEFFFPAAAVPVSVLGVAEANAVTLGEPYPNYIAINCGSTWDAPRLEGFASLAKRAHSRTQGLPMNGSGKPFIAFPIGIPYIPSFIWSPARRK